MPRNMFWNKRNLIAIILIFAGVTIFFIVRNNNSAFTPFKVEDNAFVLSGSADYSFSIPVDSITSVELTEYADMGETLEDHSTKNYISGTYKNDQFGTYKACLLKKVKKCISVTCSDGSVYIFNYESARSTEELHKAILKYIDK